MSSGSFEPIPVAAATKLPPAVAELLTGYGWRLATLDKVGRGFGPRSRRWRALYRKDDIGLVLEADARRKLIGPQTLMRGNQPPQWLSSLAEVHQAIGTGQAPTAVSDVRQLPAGFTGSTVLQ